MTIPKVRQHPEHLEWVGKSIPRVEDPKFLRGRGNYIDDYEVPNMLEVAVARSTVAHAKILSIDTSAAEAVPGVVAIVTSENVKDHVNPMPDFGPAPDKHTWHCLAVDKVRYMGEGVAVVAATSRAVAEDAAELIEVEYEPLEPLTGTLAALADDAPLIHEALGSNVPFHRKFAFGDVDGDFAAADVIVRDTLHWGRSGGQPLETVGAVADYDAATGMLTIHVNSMSFTHFLFLLANTLRVPSNKLDLHPHPSGGSFGAKFFEVKTATIAGMMARITGRPVKFMQDRLDNIANGDHHGSDRYYEAELAAKSDGTMLSARFKVVDNYGAYIQFGVGQHGNSLAQAVGPYRMSSIGYDLTAVLTNKCQQGAYRGFGSEVGNWILERMVDLMATELDMDPVDIRRMNFIQPDQFPYFIPTGNVYDSGDYEAVLNKTMELSDYRGWRKRQAEMRAEGRHIGIGVCTCQERSVFSATEFWFWFDEPVAAPVTSAPESVTLKVDAMGAVT
ncbi:MAG: xanthine dehydrogenase family protein molybdopterin-binding subunit, partial [bacterium]|nr:xanthine dehydrogenase family protein molybdopterin-binding subunit [bacterium]